jgi:hypothetical protein
MNTLPSSAYIVLPPTCQATVESSRFRETAGLSPQAHLPEQRRLLIAGDAGNGHRGETERRRHATVDLAR